MNIFHIAGRELKMYLTSPWTYVVLAAAIFAIGIFFGLTMVWFSEICQRPAAGGYMGPTHHNLHTDVLSDFVSTMGIILIFITPPMTMHLIAGERRQRSIELLLTSPVSSWEIVLGKFVGALGLFGVMLVFLGYVPIMLYTFGEPDTGIMLTTLLGVVMLFACSISVGIAASSLSENMIVSAVLAFVVLLSFWIIEIGTVVAQGGWLKDALEMMSLVRHLGNFNAGMIDTRDIIYMVSFSTFFLFIAQQRIESLRWK